MIPIFIFALANSTDAFLLVKLNQSGISSKWIPLLWSCLHIVKMFSTFWGGRLADHYNKLKLLVLSWILFSIIYFFFGYIENIWGLVFVFLFYGLFFGLSEPSERALISILSSRKKMGTSFGVFNFSISLAALPSNLFFGWIWSQWGSFVAFAVSSGLAFLAGIIVLTNFKIIKKEG
jgi:MFS family permease